MRYLITDPTGQDPRALLTAEKMATLTNIVAPTQQYITASGLNELAVSSDCIITIDGSGVFKTNTATLGVSNLDVGGSFTVGKDYYVYICDRGSGHDEIYVISLNSTYPNGYTAYNSRKIGGFHYGIVRSINSKLQPVNSSGVIRGTGWEGNVSNGILPRSVWTLHHRPKCSPEGMVYLGHGVWVDIYLSSDDGAGGLATVHNATPLTGTEGLNWFDFVDRANVVGKRLHSYMEFCQLAFGSPQGNDADNNNAWSATTNTGRQLTGFVKNAVSSIGCCDAVGNANEWFSDLTTRGEHTVIAGSGIFPSYDGARAGKSYTDGNGHGTVGLWGWDTVSPLGDSNGNIHQFYDYSLHALVGGGGYNNGVRAGARAVNCSSAFLWLVNTSVGARCACESL